MMAEGCLAQSKDNKTSTCQRDSCDKNFTHPKKKLIYVGILYKFTLFIKTGTIYLRSVHK